MSHQSELISQDIHAYLKDHEHKTLCRFITCGSVDDGKSTLIGRLLYESKLIYEDQLNALESDSKKDGTQGGDIDFALLVDGLAAEREQGITIDVAYRFFSTETRKFIVADTPGHEQYTRNMATGASTADVAILMIDARKGILTQTRRHSTIVHMLGVKKLLLAINKMDLVEYSEDVFESIKSDYQTFAQETGISSFSAIPLSALKGDNIIESSSNMPWYSGQTLLQYLETVDLPKVKENTAFSLPVQWVNRPNLDFRGFSGQIASGRVSVGDKIRVLPANTESTVDRIVTFDGDLNTAIRGQSITLTLADEMDISRGDLLVSEQSDVDVSESFNTTLLWMSDSPMVPDAEYWVKIRAKMVSATFSKPQHRLDINTGQKQAAETLSLNEIGDCSLILDQAIAFESYLDNKQLGSFIIIDRVTNNTVGMGLINSAVTTESWVDRYVERRNQYWVRSEVSAESRAKKNGHKPLFILFTGNVEKSSYSAYETACETALFDAGYQAYRYGFQVMKTVDDSIDYDAMRQETIRHIVGIGHAFMDSGQVFITGMKRLTQKELTAIKAICEPFGVITVGIGQTDLKTDVSLTSKDELDELMKLLNQLI